MDKTSSSLLRGIVDFDDHQRWFEFNRIYRPLIRNILINKGLRGQELEDVIQEVYLALLTTLDRFQYDPAKGKFRNWVGRIAQRAASAYYRKSPALPVDPADLDDTQSRDAGALPDCDDQRMALCLQMARTRFDEQTWAPFHLRVIEGTPIDEVERITKMKRNAIYQAVHRVKTCLRDMLAQLDAEHRPPHRP